MIYKELRIGNYVYNPIQKIDLKVDIKVLSEVFYDEKRKVKLNNQFQPIPLTEEWLIKLRFDDLGNYGYGIGSFHIINRLGKWAFPINDKMVFLDYVHQLQNLFYALAKRELEI